MIECEVLDGLIRHYTRFAGLHGFLRTALHEWVLQQTVMQASHSGTLHRTPGVASGP